MSFSLGYLKSQKCLLNTFLKDKKIVHKNLIYEFINFAWKWYMLVNIDCNSCYPKVDTYGGGSTY